jgi:LPS-assembly lipoprotein
MQKHLFLLIVLGIFLGLISGCGFHLRGVTDSYQFPYKTMYLDCDTPIICPNLSKTIQAESLTTLVSHPESAEVTLTVNNEQTSRDAYGFNSVGQVASYLLTYQVTARLYTKQGNQIGRDMIIKNQMLMNYNNSLILSAQQQEAHDWDLIHQNIVNSLIRRIVYSQPHLASSSNNDFESH